MDQSTKNSSRPEVIDIIVVAYRNDIFFLEIQARSILLYIPPEKIGNIYICVNDEDNYCKFIDSNWWGHLSHKVKIIPKSYFGSDPTLDGWSSQQLYKILLANQAESTWSLCLDSKTWFVKNLDWELWFDDNGCVNLHSFPTIPVFKSAQDFLEKYFNIKNPKVIGPGGVPFMFHTKTVQDMCNTIPEFFKFFCENVRNKINVTEFMLYSGYVTKIHGDYSKLYSDKQFYKFCNLADWQIQEFDNVWELSTHKELLTISIQERAYTHLSDQQFDTWIRYLQNKNLLKDRDPITKKLNTLR